VRAGVALAAASFVAVAVTARAEAGSSLRFLLPLFVAVWIAGMSVFQAPALAIVRDATDADGLPAAMPPLVLATVLPTAAWPWVQVALERLGGSATFLAGGVAVVGTALALGRSADLRPAAPRDDAPAGSGGSLAGAFACGLASAAVVVLATDRVPAALAGPAIGVATLAAIAGIVAALGATPAARAGMRVGGVRALVAGLVVAALCRVAAAASPGALGAIAIAGVAGGALALHLANALPVVLVADHGRRAGLATGLYLGGAMLGSRLAALASAAL
jgi:hypothetical protein